MTKRRANCPLEEEAQTAKMSPVSLTSRSQVPEAIIQKGPLFDPVNFTSLIQIVNELNPGSFSRFSRTCKDLHDFCYNAKGIQVQFRCKICVERRENNETEISMKKYDGEGGAGRVISEEELQMLQQMPFIIVVKELELEPADSRLLEEARQLLRRFRRVFVATMTMDWTDEDWNNVIQFIQDYNVKSVHISPTWERRPVIPEHLLPFFLSNLDHFYYAKDVADDLIVSATAKRLFLPAASISKYTFMNLLQKCANEDIVNLLIGREPHDALNAESDPFIQACSEMMKVVKMEEIDWKNMEPSVLYNRPSDPRKFYLHYSDGSIGKLHFFGNCVFFGTGF